MNRYQQEVARIDSRRHRVVRGLTFLGAAGLVAVALWAADPPIRALLDADESKHAPPPPAPLAASTTVVADGHATTGNESSIASIPQRLQVVSTSPGRNPQEGTARIGTSRDNPQTYVSGAILVNGARLAEIHADHVVLERGTKRVSLFLASARNAQAQGSIDLATVPAMSNEPAPAKLLGVDSLGEVIRSMAYYENDMLQGLQVFPGRQSGTFARLGLKPADVIVSIDSVAVTDAQSAVDYLQDLTQGAAVSVRVRRGADTYTLSLDGTLMESASSKTSTLAQPAQPDLGRNFQ